jgi:hypothetical protein
VSSVTITVGSNTFTTAAGAMIGIAPSAGFTLSSNSGQTQPIAQQFTASYITP